MAYDIDNKLHSRKGKGDVNKKAPASLYQDGKAEKRKGATTTNKQVSAQVDEVNDKKRKRSANMNAPAQVDKDVGKQPKKVTCPATDKTPSPVGNGADNQSTEKQHRPATKKVDAQVSSGRSSKSKRKQAIGDDQQSEVIDYVSNAMTLGTIKLLLLRRNIS